MKFKKGVLCTFEMRVRFLGELLTEANKRSWLLKGSPFNECLIQVELSGTKLQFRKHFSSSKTGRKGLELKTKKTHRAESII